jgi:type 1 glutamine amidotransferase
MTFPSRFRPLARLTLCAALVAVAGSWLPGSGPADAAPRRLWALLVSGQNNHNWRETTPHIEKFLESTGRFEVITTEDPGTYMADAKNLKYFNVIVLNYNGSRWGAAADTNFLAAVREGTGVSVIHAANNAFSGWAEYDKIIGIGWRQTAGHGAYHSFDVKYNVKDHPITRGLTDMKAHPDELYHRLTVTPNEPMTVLATAMSSTASGGTGADEPMALVKSYGKGRVFHTPLGHDLNAMQDPQFMTLTARGTEWAATGEVTIPSVAAQK